MQLTIQLPSNELISLETSSFETLISKLSSVINWDIYDIYLNDQLLSKEYFPISNDTFYSIKQKPLTVVFSGSVDRGKSTLVGHLLKILGYVSDREFEKITDDSIIIGMEKWKYANILDILPDERESGKTKDFCMTPIIYKNRPIHFIDTPGHKQLVRCMIEGATHTDVGILVCSVKKGEFEAGMVGSTKEHIYLLRGLGVKQLVIVLNKMDTINWDKDEYIKYETSIKSFVKKVKFPLVQVVAVSAWEGKNLIDEYSTWGPSLMEILLSLNVRPKEIPIEYTPSSTITCQLLLLESSYLFSIGFECILHNGGSYYPVELISIEGKKRILRPQESGIVKLKWLGETPEKLYPHVILRKEDSTIAIGMIRDNK